MPPDDQLPDASEDRKPRASQIMERYNGDAMRVAEKLADALGDNYGYREQLRTLKSEVETLKAKVVPDDAVVLTGDDKAHWQVYRELGKPDEVQARLGERDKLNDELTTLKRDELLRDAAQVAGYKFSVLKDRASGLNVELRDVTEDGKTVKRAVVKTESGEQPLSEYAERHWGDYLPALRANAATPAATGTPYPSQASSTAATGAPDLVSQFIERRQKTIEQAPNPLLAPATVQQAP